MTIHEWEIHHEAIHPTNREAVNQFLLTKYLANRSLLTLDHYRRHLQKFLIDCPKLLVEITADDVIGWIQIHYGDKKETTRNNRLTVLTSFFAFCADEGYIQHVPVKPWWRAKLPKPVPRYLDETELAKVRLAAETLWLRNRLIIEFFLSSGVRIFELVNLRNDDVDVAQRTARIIGKGKKFRWVHFSETCALLLEAYRNIRPQGDPELFLNATGKKLTTRGVHYIVSDLGKQAGLTRNLSPHALRHSFATQLLNKGADLGFISEELGHGNLNTTRIYANLPKEELAAMYDRYMG
ncbi:tyrosine-type recombinase/integrase [Heliobacterium mobile]|uniref:tyrosine-type recombinase/integrase n=1 Tax=Heliobacterium mobile TaxID=28064 RepID=UPI001478192D|nr:tyrosine-type recombinase/integrase [Heliobacterium mobile]